MAHTGMNQGYTQSKHCRIYRYTKPAEVVGLTVYKLIFLHISLNHLLKLFK